LRILQISNNTSELLGISPEDLLNRELQELLGSRQVTALKQCLAADFSSVNPLKISFKRAKKTLVFSAIIHRSDGVAILELEPDISKKKATFLNFYNLVKSSIEKLENTATTLELCEVSASVIQQMTGFDRVMVYRFDTDASGEVVAENKPEQLEPYLGLHFPAIDIPFPARRLFILNRVLVIPNVNYQPVDIIPAHHPVTQKPLDLSLSILRSISPCHREYLNHMGVEAAMVIALIDNQKLWGIIACHHRSPKFVNYEMQTACNFLGKIISLELSSKEKKYDLEYKLKLKNTHSQLINSIVQTENLRDGLAESPLAILDLVGASGSAICLNNEIKLVGKTPQLADIQKLVEWLDQTVENNIFYTESLPRIYPNAEKFKEVACGLFALTLSKIQKNYVLWFRPEVIQTVSWAGNPKGSHKIKADGTRPLCPRQSFELWKETNQDKSLPWSIAEINAVQEFKNAIVGMVLRQADELASINLELQRSNDELDAFAYIASHDLKEPLRGIHNYANFLIEDYAEILNEDGVTKLQTLVRLTQRMEDLINSLLHFSRLGRAELSRQTVNLEELVQQVIATLTIARPQTIVEFRIPRSLPSIECDRAQINELFTNLISNSIKYNNRPEKWVEIGFLTPSEPLTFYVRDNGIGIPPQHLDKIFQIFRRLHGRDEFGGGTGAGLTIARKIVERHGGNIWVESKPDEGSTFFFTLSAEMIAIT
jgi:two-component system, chemotaxis family, sensor kinase Cph1